MAFALALLFLLPSACLLAQSSPEEAVAAPDVEAELLRLANLERQQRGIAPLQPDAQATAAARAHTRLMATHGGIAHFFPGEADLLRRISAQGVRLDAAAENVVMNYSAAFTHESVMNSPHHRENLLNPRYNAVGIGAIRVGDRIYVTQDFVRRFDEFSPDEAEQRIGATLSQLRRSHKLLPLTLAEGRDLLRQHACQMAADEHINTRPPAGLLHLRFLVASTTFQPEQLPEGAFNPALDSTVKGYAVGVCPARPGSPTPGVLWVTLAFF